MKRKKLVPVELSKQKREIHDCVHKDIDASMNAIARASINLLDTLEDFPPELKAEYSVVLGYKIIQNAAISILNTERMAEMNKRLSTVIEGIQDLQEIIEDESPYICR